MADRYNEPDKGTRRWHEPLNENFSDLGIEVTNEVATWSDLPTPTGETSSNGQPRVYRVDADDVVVKDTGSDWRIIGGRGSSNRPLPPVDAERVSSPVHSIDTNLDASVSVTIPTSEHQQVVIPKDRSYDVDGELVVDGSFVFMGL